MADAYSECWDFISRGKCPRGDKCKWSHSQVAKQSSSVTNSLATVYHEVPDESQFCWNYMRTGTCPRGDRCRWIHDLYHSPDSYLPSPQFPAFPHTPTGNGNVPVISTALYDSDVNHSPKIPTTPESYWDQFSENQRLFGTTSSFDPSMSAYTTPLYVESLTAEQIAKADELSQVLLPSEKLSETESFPLSCPFCSRTISDLDGLVHHAESAINGQQDVCSEEGVKALKGALKRKSWIIVQESMPAGLVSQVQGIYKRQITSSTNMQSILESIVKSDLLTDDVRSHLHREIVCSITSMALRAAGGGSHKQPQSS